MFKEIPASESSKSRRKLVFGHGVNDADYIVRPRVNGKLLMCPFYTKWHGMFKRCYSDKAHKQRPKYAGCTVCDEWKVFSNFKRWMKLQDWEGKDIDKDIAITGNKIYSPNTCIFVTQEINKLLGDHGSARGDHSQGVFLDKRYGTFQAACNDNGKKKHLGSFGTESKASNAYKKFKSKVILETAMKQDEPLKSYLIRISNEYLA